jgi:short-subunit dehydrogenase
MQQAKTKTVLITGASGAIGAALARAYAAPGRVLVLHGRKEARLLEVARACERLGATVETKALDVRDHGALTAWLEGVSSRHAVDLAVVNAGAIHVLEPGAVESWQDAERVLSVNVVAAIATVTALLPHMRRRGRGQVALMGSLLAWFGLPQAPAYCASKAALKIYGEALRAPLAREGIRVSVVLPGFVKSEMSDALRLPKPFMLSAEDAAARIKHGLERDKARISFPLPLAAGCWMLSAMPPAIARAMLGLLGFDGR